MIKEELARAVSRRLRISQVAVAQVIEETLDVIVETASHGESVQLVGFGAFELKRRASRIGRNPGTGEAVPIPERYMPVFKPGKRLLDAAAEYQKEEAT